MSLGTFHRLLSFLTRKQAGGSSPKEKDFAEAVSSLQTEAGSSTLMTLATQSRSSLMGILGMCEMLGDASLSPKDRRCLEAIRDLSEMLLHLVQDMIDLERLESGKFELHEAVWDWGSWLEATTMSLHLEAEEKGLRFQYSSDSGIGPNLRGDPWRLRQVIRLLFTNAIKFTNEGEVNLRVHLVQDLKEQVVLRFEISDTGVGFDASPTESVSSMGIGLRLSRHLLALMDSKLLVRSNPSKGCTAAFVVSLAKAKNGEESLREIPQMPAAGNKTPSKGQVLLLTGDSGGQFVLECFLVSMGLTVAIADSPARALQMVSELRFRLIVIDVDSFPFDAPQFARRLGEMEPMGEKTPLLALVPAGASLTREQYREAGFTDCVRKPLSPEDWFPYLPR